MTNGAKMKEEFKGQRQRMRMTKKGLRHTVNPAGTKVRRIAARGKVGCRHGHPIHSMV